MRIVVNNIDNANSNDNDKKRKIIMIVLIVMTIIELQSIIKMREKKYVVNDIRTVKNVNK